MKNYNAGVFRVKAINHKWDPEKRAYDEIVKEGFVEIEIDIDRLVRELGARAVRSKSGVAVEAGGAVKVKRVKDIAGSVNQGAIFSESGVLID